MAAGADRREYPWRTHRSIGEADAQEPSYAIAQAVEQEPPATGQADLAAYRRGLKASARRRAGTRFHGDVNRQLSADQDGLTIDQLADGVPIDDWFAAGLTVPDAVKRCLDWRRIGTVLPPDEVQDGEVDLPVGLLQSGARQQIVASEPEADPEAEARIEAVPEETRGTAEIVETAEPRRTRAAKGNGHVKRDFDSFCAQVDAIVAARVGLSLDDLVDVPLRDWFDAHLSAKRAAGRAIAAQKNS